MSIIAAAVKHLLAAGVAHEQIVAAVQDMERAGAPSRATVDPAVERRRAYDRERKRKKKAEIAGIPHGIPEEIVENAEIAGIPVDALPPSESPPSSPQTPNLPPLNSPQLSLRSNGPQLVLVASSPESSPDWFALGWEAFPKAGRRRSGTEAAKAQWTKAAKRVGGEAELVDCIKRFACSHEAVRQGGQFVQGFHRWLRDGGAANWTSDSHEEDSHGDYGTVAPTGRELENSDALRGMHAAAVEARARSQ